MRVPNMYNTIVMPQDNILNFKDFVYEYDV